VPVAIRFGWLALALVVLAPGQAAAEWQLKPFLGWTLGGETTLNDPDPAVARRHGAYGVNVALLGEIFGVEADVAFVPRLFQSGRGDSLVIDSSTFTLSAGALVAMPRSRTQYTLRPYAVAGLGLMRAQLDDAARFYEFTTHMAAVNVGGGVTGFLNHWVGVSWDLRYFRSVGGRDEGLGISVGDPRLSFWRASMALAIKY
jgi:opacity protein-like surface antigen